MDSRRLAEEEKSFDTDWRDGTDEEGLKEENAKPVLPNLAGRGIVGLNRRGA